MRCAGAPVSHILPHMDTLDIKSYLQGVNLIAFCQEYRLPLRTMVRLRTGSSTKPTKATVEMASKAIKLAQRREARRAAA